MKKHMYKRFSALLLAALIAFCCAACSSDPSPEDSTSSDVSSQVSDFTTSTASTSKATSTSGSRSPQTNPHVNNKTTSAGKRTTAKPTTAPTVKPVETVRLTIPEGFTVDQIAKRLEKNGVCSAKEFVRIAQTYSPKSFSVPADSNRAYKMEGYLFPDTYEFYVDDDPQDVLIKLLNNYYAKAGGISDKQLIVASIVEKESRSQENAALVASVIYNRLKASMKLDMDSTREYINNHVTNSPFLSGTGKYAALYNTYKCAGLPAGPICSPGSRAIQAAQHPADSEYLYFFFGKDNQNHYSKTYEEHKAAMEKYGVQYH